MPVNPAKDQPVKDLTSAVTWAVLGLVIERASYCWEINNRFDRVYDGALSLGGESHVYGVIDRLLKRGFVEPVPGTSDGIGRQPKTHYRATATGIRAYEDWVAAELADERRRQELWVRQLGVFANDPQAALRVIARAEQAYLKTAGHSAPSPAAGRSALIDHLIADRHGLTEEGMITWFQHAREGFEAL